MAIARVASGHIAGATFDVGGTAVDTVIDIGTCDFLIVSVTWGENNAHSIASVVWDQGGTGQAMTQFGAQTGNTVIHKHSFYLSSPTNGNLTLRVDPSAGSGSTTTLVIDWESFSGVDVGGTPFDGYSSNLYSGVTLTSTVTVTSEVGDFAWFSHAGVLSGGNPTAVAPTSYTERHETLDAGLGVSSGDAAGAASIATTATYTSGGFAINSNAHGVNLNAASSGPATGFVLTPESGTTDGSGVLTTTATSDDAMTANGEVRLITATVNGTVAARLTHRPS